MCLVSVALFLYCTLGTKTSLLHFEVTFGYMQGSARNSSAETVVHAHKVTHRSQTKKAEQELPPKRIPGGMPTKGMG